ncbi:hypothetical protein PHYSODRAFT_508313 [Phytophthora sojae]|uniref:RNase H type-1 domain-containing protein n=1 Tax=Phytophthora sojae (strain P6497) TaxID=1094619 RepID=G4ZLV8_PHYSP|nr:hypothetical protein PHYSODRAFT_508313 [Phytophthora sojae]EGZ15293.1 hypothetical protein PHYSODRAFT_508313 [Phytophthora sojae]|eukprot:XP_009529042.1 hypothetical protein PHYSODRAFT_508313 [Phytophthora sojae]
MSYAAATTTNNQAEYRGLLYAARTPEIRPLHVVGDSQHIVRQQHRRNPPKVEHLRVLYQRCRVAADICVVRSWIYHLREFNKTADWPANMAMDSRFSRQVVFDGNAHSETLWRPAAQLAAGDIQYWMDGRLSER